MKAITLYLLMLLVSFAAQAVDNESQTQVSFQQPLITASTDLEAVQSFSLPQEILPSNDNEQLPATRQDEIATEIFIYLLIITAYSLYWKNIS